MRQDAPRFKALLKIVLRMCGVAVTALACTTAPAAQPTLQQVLQAHANVPHTAASLEAASQAVAWTAEDALHAMAEQADVVFAGEVIAIHHDEGAVRVEWRVLQGLVGVQAGQNFVLREWAGLWMNDDARYRLGQRALLLLHAASAAGFRSPVGGQDGVIPIQGELLSGTADLRWIATRVARADASVIGPAASVLRTAASTGLLAHTETVPAPVSNAQASPTSVSTAPVGNEQGAPPALRAVDASLVIDLLHAWSRRSPR